MLRAADRKGGAALSYHLSDPVSVLPGVGPARAKRLEKLGLFTLADLVRFYPRAYEDRRETYAITAAPADKPVCIRAMVVSPPRTAHIRKGLDLTKVTAADASGALVLTYFNQSYLSKSLVQGQEYVFFGTAEGSGARRTMANPVTEPAGRCRLTGRIVPVYSLTAGISANLLQGAVDWALSACLDQLPDRLPPAVRRAYQLPEAAWAVKAVHAPPDWETLETARRRLVFEEFFFLSAGLSLLRTRRDKAAGTPLPPAPLSEFCAALPFQFTGAQRRAAEDAFRDMTAPRPMNRLIQGDVGSGKTMVAAACAWLAARGGCQSALMAPTEILAEQHFRTLASLLGKFGFKVGLLTAGMGAKEKRAALAGAADGSIQLLIGTQALLSGSAAFARLGLVITDEQHRFGVNQRAALSGKGVSPHVLVMSATPIPRTLALILYGDLDVSVIDELPPGRQKIDTFLIGEDKRARLYAFVEKQIAQGGQVYFICPAVEDSPEGENAGELRSVTAYAAELKRLFPNRRVGLVHGRLKGAEKDAVMAAFAAGELDILVSTTVVEVGVDVPNATLMVIENAERFGLSQLHQLRGRVGRGSAKSYCILFTANRSPDTLARLKVLCATGDGFQIAEEDLKLRGPGNFFGTQQHGLPPMKVADLAGDGQVLAQAREAAGRLLAADPGLTRPENRGVLAQVQALFRQNPDIFN